VLTHHRPVTGSTVRPYCILQAAAPGRKPGIARKRIPPSRSLFAANQYKAAQSLLLKYLPHGSIFVWNMQAFFTALDEKSPAWYGYFTKIKGVWIQ